MAHGTKATPALELVAGDGAKQDSPASRTLNAARRAGRALASRFFGRAASESGGYRASAKALGVSVAQVGRWADEDEPSAITVGDVIACGPAVITSIAQQLLAYADTVRTVRPPRLAPERHLGLLMGQLGGLANQIAEASADGVWTEAEIRAALGKAKELHARVSAHEADLCAKLMDVMAGGKKP